MELAQSQPHTSHGSLAVARPTARECLSDTWSPYLTETGQVIPDANRTLRRMRDEPAGELATACFGHRPCLSWLTNKYTLILSFGPR